MILAFDYEITASLDDGGLILSNRDTDIFVAPEQLPAVAAALARWGKHARTGRFNASTEPEQFAPNLTIQLEGGRVVNICQDHTDQHHLDGGLDVVIVATGSAHGTPVFPPDGTNGYICMSPAQAANLATSLKSALGAAGNSL